MRLASLNAAEGPNELRLPTEAALSQRYGKREGGQQEGGGREVNHGEERVRLIHGGQPTQSKLVSPWAARARGPPRMPGYQCPLVRAGFGMQEVCRQRMRRQRSRRRSAIFLFMKREEIAIELAKEISIRAIAHKLARSPSTISREVRRNAATRSGNLDYRASAAQWHADRAARRPRPSKLAANAALRDYVEEHLAGKVTNRRGVSFDGPKVVWKKRRAVHRQSRRWSTAWSPEQIARRLRIDHPEDPAMRISHEAIYRLFTSRGAEHCAGN